MKKSLLFGSIWLLLLFATTPSLYGQDFPEKITNKELKVKKRTVLEQYEADMVLSPEDRIRLKKERLATIKKRRGIIDTLDISDRKRRRLLKELYRSPFSDQWEKVIADIEFEQEEY